MFPVPQSVKGDRAVMEFPGGIGFCRELTVDENGRAVSELLDAGEYTMKRFAGLYGMTYSGMATNKNEATKLGKNI